MFAARKRESLIIRESAGAEINPLLKRVVSYHDNESMWISLVIEDGDEFERVSPWAARAIMFASHVWTWRVIVLCCIWYLLTSLASFDIANIPLQLALIAASAYLSTSMRSLFRSSSNNENSGAARQFRLQPGMKTCLAYNCFDPFATAGAQLQAAKKNGCLRNSAVILNAYETGDAILKYIRANHDNFENSLAILDLRARSNSLSSFRSSGQSPSTGRLHHDQEMRTFAPMAIPMPMPRPGPLPPPLSPRDVLLESQQLDLLRLTINKPVVVVYNQISFLPLLSAIGVVSGMIFMVCLWLSCPDVVSCVLNAQSIPYSILMMMWIGGGVVLFCFWRICCGILIAAGTIMIAKLKISRLASSLQDQYRGLVMPTFEQEMEEYLLIQQMFRKISEFFQLHVIISSFFCLLLFVLGLYWGLYGEAIAYSLAMLVISSVVLLSILLSCTVANEIAQEIQLTLSRSKPGDFLLGGSDETETAGAAGEAKNPRKEWQEIAEQNKIQYTVYGFAVTRAWLATVSLSIFTSVLALFIQRQLTG